MNSSNGAGAPNPQSLVTTYIADPLAELDKERLLDIPYRELARQHSARQTVHAYFLAFWKELKQAGADPATDPRYSVLAAMVDLTAQLRDHAASIRRFEYPEEE